MAVLDSGITGVPAPSAASAGPDRRRSALAGILGAVVCAGCAAGGAPSPGTPAEYPQAYYRTGSPFRDVSGDLNEALRSVVRVRVQGSYDSYVFAEDDAPTVEDLRDPTGDALARAIDVGTSVMTQAASAVVVASVRGRGTLITTHHGVTLPDTTVAYFGAAAATRGGARLVQRASIKRTQTNTVVARAFVEPFELLGSDEETDLAVIGIELSAGVDPGEIRRMRLSSGAAGRLSWGSLVYILGHPAGYQMVTQAVVSRPDLGEGDRFLTDGLLNEGSSGAPILAVRGDSEELEWVGIAGAAASRTQYRLEPEAGPPGPDEPPTLYDGPIFLSQVQEMRPGITFAIPLGEARDLLAGLRPWLEAVGYPIPEL